MVERIVEGSLRFDFPAPWNAVKFDDTRWYRESMKSHVKAVDIVAFAGHRHWWIEVKDCLGYEEINKPRLADGESDSVKAVRTWLASTPYRDVVVKRAKPFIVDELAAKVEGTLVSLIAAHRSDAPVATTGPEAHLQSAAEVLLPKAVWSLALILTWRPDAHDFGRLAMRLSDKLEKRFRAFNLACYVLNETDRAPNQPWSMTRIAE